MLLESPLDFTGEYTMKYDHPEHWEYDYPEDWKNARFAAKKRCHEKNPAVLSLTLLKTMLEETSRDHHNLPPQRWIRMEYAGKLTIFYDYHHTPSWPDEGKGDICIWHYGDPFNYYTNALCPGGNSAE